MPLSTQLRITQKRMQNNVIEACNTKIKYKIDAH